MEYLIDPDGSWWRWPSPVLSARLGYEEPDFDLAAYAARNLGYVWIVLESDLTLLQFRAGALSRKAIEAAADFIDRSSGTPIALVYFASGWIEEASADAGAMAKRIRELGVLPEPQMRPLYLNNEVDPARWQRTDKTDLSALLGLWRANAGQWDSRVSGFLAGSGLASRTVVIEPKDSKLFVLESGRGFTIYDGYGMSSQVGNDMAAQPDRSYGEWVSRFYWTTHQSGEPRLDDIDAIVAEPNHDPRRRRYRRLILQWKKANGAPRRAKMRTTSTL